MYKIREIDINCDLGEGMSNDSLIMPYITSCNIACGGHFGDKNTIREAIRLAVLNDVKVGAHPSFPDKVNFGRKVMDIAPKDLEASIRLQVTDFKEVCDELGVEMNHVKLHGALYNLAYKDEKIMETVLKALEPFSKMKLYVSASSLIPSKKPENIEFYREAFIDRSYQDDGSLVSRDFSFASIESREKAYKQFVTIFMESKLETVSGKRIPINAETFCIHGDNPKALEILQYIHQKMHKNG
jgi:5-oxoprolinase (ATP-hydrolysing) subunit A